MVWKFNYKTWENIADRADGCFLYLMCSLAWLLQLHWLPFTLCSSECENYRTLSNGDRKITNTGHARCDRSLDPGWFRFQGAAGNRMPTLCPAIYSCSTHAPGWLNRGHPTVADGRVTRQVCFHWSSNCCQYSTHIQVRNCGSFYVYYFKGTSHCYLRYCSTD